MTNDNTYLPVEEAASALHLDVRTVRDWLKKGKLVGIRPGKKWLIPKCEVDRLLGAAANSSAQAGTEFRVGQCFRVWLGGEVFATVRSKAVEVIPVSSGSVVDFGPLGPEEATTRVTSEALGLRGDDLARFRIKVVDDLEVTLVEADVPVYRERQGIRHVVDAFTAHSDPNLESTKFWSYGNNRQLRIRVKNPTRYGLKLARVSFSGSIITTDPVKTSEAEVVDAVTRGWL